MIFDGKKLARAIQEKIKTDIQREDIKPVLAIVSVDADERTKAYLKAKERFGRECGVEVRVFSFDRNTKAEIIKDTIDNLGKDEDVNGIIVQLPLPQNLDTREILDHIPPRKDVDALTTHNSGLIYIGKPKIIPATARGVVTILDHYGVSIDGANVLVIGRSLLVGKPIANALLSRNATVTLAHSHSKDLRSKIKQFDIIISATGNGDVLRGVHFDDGQVLIDVGLRSDEGKLLGDIEEDAKKNTAGFTPVPGGVGPMTVASLFMNLLEASRRMM